MICPYCGIGTSPKLSNSTRLGTDERGRAFGTGTGNCSECGGLIVVGRLIMNPDSEYTHVDQELLLYPPGPQARTVDPLVSGEYAQDFREASLVFDLSPKASAALSRRLLQRILHEKAGIRGRDLNAEIDKAIEQGELSSPLAEDLDAVRTVGNFAAHPLKSTSTGEVVDVEPGEAEFLLDVVEQLFEHYFVRPARRAEQREKLNAKLAEAGKQPLKEASEAGH